MAKLAEVKTKENEASVVDFINLVEHKQKRKDSLLLIEIMEKATMEKPRMWGASIVGFGKVRIKSQSGREVEWLRMGFSPRKTNLSLYLSCDLKTQVATLEKLGKHKTGVGCLYINKLADVDLNVLEDMIITSAKTSK